MEVVHLNQKQPATRWGVSEARLSRWRSEGIGSKLLTISPGAKLDSRRLPAGGAPRMAHIKLCGRVLYRQIDIEHNDQPAWPIQIVETLVIFDIFAGEQ